jgi:hypothetical protein
MYRTPLIPLFVIIYKEYVLFIVTPLCDMVGNVWYYDSCYSRHGN